MGTPRGDEDTRDNPLTLPTRKREFHEIDSYSTGDRMKSRRTIPTHGVGHVSGSSGHGGRPSPNESIDVIDLTGYVRRASSDAMILLTDAGTMSISMLGVFHNSLFKTGDENRRRKIDRWQCSCPANSRQRLPLPLCHLLPTPNLLSDRPLNSSKLRCPEHLCVIFTLLAYTYQAETHLAPGHTRKVQDQGHSP